MDMGADRRNIFVTILISLPTALSWGYFGPGNPGSTIIAGTHAPQMQQPFLTDNLPMGNSYRAPSIRSMGLEMRSACKQCDPPLTMRSAAFICSYECTFCTGCAGSMKPHLSELRA